ncbi:hypothetical protein LWI29_011022 [Acer saccharum]|uniref:Uncharacterized protein n=1 Tax=Acer saccharum TaxID=4024 RepID=A0AA39T9H6_ACESA|nr:hypothetical protein LWI29_011022 [Acer saccharum]
MVMFANKKGRKTSIRFHRCTCHSWYTRRPRLRKRPDMHRYTCRFADMVHKLRSKLRKTSANNRCTYSPHAWCTGRGPGCDKSLQFETGEISAILFNEDNIPSTLEALKMLGASSTHQGQVEAIACTFCGMYGHETWGCNSRGELSNDGGQAQASNYNPWPMHEPWEISTIQGQAMNGVPIRTNWIGGEIKTLKLMPIEEYPKGREEKIWLQQENQILRDMVKALKAKVDASFEEWYFFASHEVTQAFPPAFDLQSTLW